MRSTLPILPFGLIAFSSTASAAPAECANCKTSKVCVDLEIPVRVVADQWLYDQPRVDNNIDAIEWHVNVTTPSSTAFSSIEDYHVDQIFKISARLCVPSQKGDKASILQIASPGQAFDKRYFDVEIDPDQYSFVDAAINKGYSILFYDRLGTGESEKPDAYKILQVPTDIEILAGLTKMARAGNLISSSTVISGDIKGEEVADFVPTKVVHIGHAYGSYLMTLMWQKYGGLSDGAVLTGFLITTIPDDEMLNVLNYNHAFPKQDDPSRFSEYGSGYIVLDNEDTIQKLFYRKATLDPALLTYSEKIKQPESVGQYASEVTFGPPQPVPDFKGPILFFTGEWDNFVCKGDCNGIINEEGAMALYPSATDWTHYLQPKTGHTPGLSTNASAGYEVILQYLDSQGL